MLCLGRRKPIWPATLKQMPLPCASSLQMAAGWGKCKKIPCKILFPAGVKCVQLFGMVQRQSAHDRGHKVHLHLLPIKKTVKGAKPPQESRSRIEATNALSKLQPKDAAGLSTWLISDGAKAYPGLAASRNVRHADCNHAKGIFVRMVKRGARKALQAHIGTIDAIWKLIKDAVPPSLHSTLPLLMLYVRQWQWRWMSASTDLFTKTGKRLYKDAF